MAHKIYPDGLTREERGDLIPPSRLLTVQSGYYFWIVDSQYGFAPFYGVVFLPKGSRDKGWTFADVHCSCLDFFYNDLGVCKHLFRSIQDFQIPPVQGPAGMFQFGPVTHRSSLLLHEPIIIESTLSVGRPSGDDLIQLVQGDGTSLRRRSAMRMSGRRR